MRINNKFSGLYYCGAPMLEDSQEYLSIQELTTDYMQAIKDYHTHKLYTFPTVEIDNKEYWAISITCDTIDEMYAVWFGMARELAWHNGTDIYFLADTQEVENAIFSEVADIIEAYRYGEGE